MGGKDDPSGISDMELVRLFQILYRYRRMLALLCLSAVVNAVAITYMISEKYEASALALLKPREQVRLNTGQSGKDILNFPLPVTIPFEAMSQTYSEFVKSRVIAERIVERLTLGPPVEDPRWWKRLIRKSKEYLGDIWLLLKYGRIEVQAPSDKIVEEIQKGISVTPSKGTYVFEISYRGRDRQQSADIANAAAQIFLDYNSETNRTDAGRTRAFLEGRLQDSKERVGQARQALRQFKQQAGIVVLDKEQTAEIESLYDLEKSLSDTRREAESTQAEIEQTHRQLSGQEFYQKSSYKITDNPLVTDLNLEIARLEIDRQGRLKTLMPSHPEVVSLDAKLATARERLAQEVKRVVSEETSAVNTVHQRLLGDLFFAEAKQQGLQVKQAGLEAAVESRRAKLRQYPDRQSLLARLELELSVSEDTYKLISREYEDARIREASSLNEIRIVSPAAVPTFPVQPIKIYYGGLALALALVVGVGVALFLEYLKMDMQASETAKGAVEGQ